MITISDRVKEAIDYLDQNRIEHALTPACIALDLTSKKYFDSKKSSGKNYKNFVNEYLWLLTYVGLPGILSNSFKVPFEHNDVNSDSDGYTSIEEIIYHVIRCGLVHSEGIDSKIKWSKIISIGIDGKDGALILSEKFIFGILAIVIFSEVNADLKQLNSSDTYWFSIADFKLFINEMWGRIDLCKKIISFYTGVIIT